MKIKLLFRSVLFLLLLGALLAGGQVHPAQALLGDLDISGTVGQADLALIDAAYGVSSSTVPLPPKWDWRADIDLDGLIDLSDLTLAGRSYADTFNFHFQRRTSNGKSNDPRLTNPFWADAVADQDGRVHIVWQESSTSETPLYYTLLDPSGNALVEDVLISNDGDSARIAVGPDDGAHIVFLKRFSGMGLYYARLDSTGRLMGAPSMLAGCSTCADPALAVDEYNHAHIVYQKPMNKALYTILGADGNLLLPAAQLNSGASDPANAFAITVSSDGARHILWRQATGSGGGELRYTRISKLGYVTSNNVTVAVLQGTYNDRRYYLAADSQNAVHFLYADNRGTPGSIYWRRVNPDGTLSAEKLISDQAVASAGLDISFSIGPSDRIHLLSAWKASGELAYARLDRDGNVLERFQRTAFEAEANAAITVDASGRAMIVAPSTSTDSFQAHPLFIASTVPDPAANDPTRADLVLDKAHLIIADQILKINEAADIRVTLTNGGPARAAGIVLTFSYPDLGGVTAQIHVPVADLDPFKSVEVHQVIPIPDFEQVDAWEVIIQAATSTSETTLSNNQVMAAFGIIPPPRMFNLEVLTFDETFAPNDQAGAEPLPGAKLELNCPITGHAQTITAGETFNIFWDIPLNLAPANGPLFQTACTVKLSKAGFSSVTAPVTAQRLSAANPYPILLGPTRSLKLYINTWGSISGTITSSGVPLDQAQLKLDSGETATTNGSGGYSFQKIPAGSHSLRIWAKGHLPIPAEPLNVSQGQNTIHNVSMLVTERAEVFGIVSNDYNQPLVGATVKFYGDGHLILTQTTGEDGTYAASIDPSSLYTSYRLDTTNLNYDPDSQVLAELVPGLPLELNIALSPTVSAGDLNVSSNSTSWIQDERWCKSYGSDEDVPLRVKILEKIGSEWCPSFQTVVNWGKFGWNLGLNYTSVDSSHTVTELIINFNNSEFMSYDVSSGMWHGGGETVSFTAERIDWVELIAIDASGNPQAVPVWKDDGVWYSSTQPDPAHVTRRLSVDSLAPAWSLAGIRIFYTIGQTAPGEDHNWKDWAPPADLGLQGSGAASGANRQVLTWWLATNNAAMRYSLADYRSFLHPAGQSGLVMVTPDPAASAALASDNSTVALVAAGAVPARLGLPFPVDLTLSGFDIRPAYGLEFTVVFNTTYMKLLSVQVGADGGGTYLRPTDIAAANAAGKISRAAIVRLAAAQGFIQARVVRLVFLPIHKTPVGSSTRLDLQTVKAADLDGELFTPTHVTDLLAVVIENAKVFLPTTRR